MKHLAVIDPKKCSPAKCSHECIKTCPINRKNEKCVFLNEDKNLAEINENLCIGCGLCVKACPFGAIKVVNLVEETGKLVHQYGKNSFRLYNLPAPKENNVVGLLGQNGVGKTTALRILSGEIKLNLGNFENPPELKEIIACFRGTELQNFFEKIKEKKIEVAYKPQQVDKIPSFFKGKVSDFLKSKNESVKDIWDRKISELSGGELQKVAIFATLEKNADIYLFDEPSSYLDVKQRLEMAKIIRKAAEKKKVLVVEHDLATLDFLSDTIYIFYGVPGVFGVVSQNKSVKKGINQFLDGFLVQENIQIRKEQINFLKRRMQIQKEEKVLEFPRMEHKFKNFSLIIEKGYILKGEVLGVLGENALGKTTFARILAGEIRPKNGSFEKIKISYKPQYLNTNFKGSVRDLLTSKFEIYSTKFQTNFIQPFELEKIMDQKIKDLSGGELQKVAIVICLAQKADLYLLDEPSAYLDVETRIKLAREIRSFVEKNEASVLIIDHDLLLLDYVSDRAIIFTGKPGNFGHAKSPMKLRKGINEFLKRLNITFRVDPRTGRPRANKLNSQKDIEQKKKGDFYCSD